MSQRRKFSLLKPEQHFTKDDYKLIARLLKKLPAKTQDIIYRRFWLNDAPHEIAERYKVIWLEITDCLEAAFKDLHARLSVEETFSRFKPDPTATNPATQAG